MPFALIIVGIVLVVSGVRDTADKLYGLVKGDFTGKHNFVYWMIAILIVGALGYIESIRPLSRAFLVLIIVVLFLSNGGFFKKFNEQISATPAPTGGVTVTTGAKQ